MGKSPFTAPLAALEFADVVAFCEQGLPESINLDYKVQMTAAEKLAKTVSSFANTFGGLIVLGVDEDAASKPNPPFDGLPFEPKLEERVWSILMEHVYPPVFPEVHVCSPMNDRTFVLIRVAQSTTTPHAIRHNTAVYLRTGNISKPELRRAGEQKIR
jgi:predicted HTH transcriptional regulator